MSVLWTYNEQILFFYTLSHTCWKPELKDVLRDLNLNIPFTSTKKVEDQKSRITPQSHFLDGNFFHFMKIEKYAL